MTSTSQIAPAVPRFAKEKIEVTMANSQVSPSTTTNPTMLKNESGAVRLSACIFASNEWMSTPSTLVSSQGAAYRADLTQDLSDIAVVFQDRIYIDC